MFYDLFVVPFDEELHYGAGDGAELVVPTSTLNHCTPTGILSKVDYRYPSHTLLNSLCNSPFRPFLKLKVLPRNGFIQRDVPP